MATGGKRDPLVKSAARVLAALEYFSERNRGATVGEVTRALGIPQSSASALLRTLTALDYLNYDRYRRIYLPAPRMALLGARIRPELFRDGRILTAMHEIRDSLSHLVLLAAHNEVYVRYLHSVPGRIAMSLKLTEDVRPMLITAPGRLFFSTFSDEKIERLVHRLNAEPHALLKAPIDLEAVMTDVAHIRKAGYAMALDTTVDGAGALAVMVDEEPGQPQLAIALIGPSPMVEKRAAAQAATVREILRRHLAPAQIPSDDQATA